ncbi:hypothetical protein D3C86_1369740 [compost metagenome]
MAAREAGAARARSGTTTNGHSSPLEAWTVIRATASRASRAGRGTFTSASNKRLRRRTNGKQSVPSPSRARTKSQNARQSASRRAGLGKFASTAV